MAAENDNALYKKLLRVYFDNSNDGIFLICGMLHFCAANRQLENWLGVEVGDLTFDHDKTVITEFIKAQDDRDLFFLNLDRALDGESRHFECEIYPANDRPRLLEISLNRAALDEGDFVIGIARDVTERCRLQSTLKYQAMHDELTGLPNRRSFMEQLAALLNDAKQHEHTHTLAYVDLDHFKVINDTSGHHVGDQYLKQISSRLQESLGDRDVLARVGGDEFGVLLSHRTPAQSKAMVEKICSVVAQHPFHWEKKIFKVSASIGYTAISKERKDISELMSYADAACYVAKDSGRNSAMEYYGGSRCAGKRKEMDWVSRINEALEQDRFQLYFQRIEPLAADGSAHREVLLRMQDKDGNIIGPGAFMPAAERYGLMPHIDRWVLNSVLNVFSAVAQDTDDEVWTINLSGASVGDKSFLDALCHSLEVHAVPAGRICFEITETMAISHITHAQDFIQRVRHLGCKVALDDFGSGMSSFSYLKNLAVDYVKIDGSLIVNVEKNETDRSIVESVNHISHTLGFETIAEFVENDAIYNTLKAIGIDYVQGYGVHVPEPVVMGEQSEERQHAPSVSFGTAQ